MIGSTFRKDNRTTACRGLPKEQLNNYSVHCSGVMNGMLFTIDRISLESGVFWSLETSLFGGVSAGFLK